MKVVQKELHVPDKLVVWGHSLGVPIATMEGKGGFIEERVTVQYTEEKAKVVAGVWGIECSQFLAALAILHQDDMKNRMNCTRML